MPSQSLPRHGPHEISQQSISSSSSNDKPIPPLPASPKLACSFGSSHPRSSHNRFLPPLTPLSPPRTPEEILMSNPLPPSPSDLPTIPCLLENWYITTHSLNQGTRQLLETYSGIPAGEITTHIRTIRDAAWNISKLPSIGTFDFLTPRINENLYYPALLKRLKGGAKLLILGPSLQVDLRILVADGVPSENLSGCDSEVEFIKLGYRLFRDAATLKSKFMIGDILSISPKLGKEVDGGFDVVYADRLLLESYADQVVAARAMMRTLRGEGSMIIGRQIGHVQSGNKDWQPSKGLQIYRHNETSFRNLWSEIGKTTGRKLKISVAMWLYLPTDPEELKAVQALCGWADPDLRWLSYEVVWGDVGLSDLLDVYVDPKREESEGSKRYGSVV